MMKTLKSPARLFAVAALGLLLAACSGASSSPESAAKNFVEKSYAGDADAVVSMVYLSDADKAKSGVEDMLRGKVKAAVERKKAYAEQRGGVDEITAEAAEPAPARDDGQQRATVKVLVKFKKGDSRHENVRLIESDGAWKIRL